MAHATVRNQQKIISSHRTIIANQNKIIHNQQRLVFEESIQPCIDAGLLDLVPSGQLTQYPALDAMGPSTRNTRLSTTRARGASSRRTPSNS